MHISRALTGNKINEKKKLFFKISFKQSKGKDEDSENKFTDPLFYEGWKRKYLSIAKSTAVVIRGKYFTSFILFVIVVSGILVGAQTYEVIDKLPQVAIIENIILFIFTLEIVLKIFIEGFAPWSFFVGKDWRWNCFDFLSLSVCLPFMGYGSASSSLFRILRLVRLSKLIEKIPQLNMIVRGLMGGLRSIAYIIMLLFLVFYIYGIVGFYTFRANDPWHFGDLQLSLTTLFTMATIDHWSDTLYVNFYGCSNYPFVYKRIELNGDFEKNNSSIKYKEAICYYDEAQPLFSTIFFVTYIVVAGLVVISLFAGTVTVSMSKSMAEMKQIQLEAEKEKKLRKARRHLSDISAKIEDEPSNFRNVVGAQIMKALHLVDMDRILHRRRIEQLKTSFLARCYSSFSSFSRCILETLWFGNAITFVILIAGVSIGAQTYVDETYDAISHLRSIRNGVDSNSTNLVNSSTSSLKPILYYIDAMVLSVFVLEVVLKVGAEEFEPWKYFYNTWNVFDFTIALVSMMPGLGKSVTILRLLRLLRILKLVNSLPQLQMIVTALISGFYSIGFIAIILFIVFYIFALGGMAAFKQNDPKHFGSLHIALISLFRCATLENWSDLMYTNMLGCMEYGYDDNDDQGLCTQETNDPQGWMAVIYFVIFEVIAALVLLTLFVGVVTSSMDESAEVMKRELKLKTRIKEIQNQYNVRDEAIRVYRLVFDMMDIDGDGAIQLEELRLGLSSIGKKRREEELRRMMEKVDVNRSGDIDFSEFVLFMIHLRFQIKDDELDMQRTSSSLKGRSLIRWNSGIKKKAKRTFLNALDTRRSSIVFHKATIAPFPCPSNQIQPENLNSLVNSTSSTSDPANNTCGLVAVNTVLPKCEFSQVTLNKTTLNEKLGDKTTIGETFDNKTTIGETFGNKTTIGETFRNKPPVLGEVILKKTPYHILNTNSLVYSRKTTSLRDEKTTTESSAKIQSREIPDELLKRPNSTEHQYQVSDPSTIQSRQDYHQGSNKKRGLENSDPSHSLALGEEQHDVPDPSRSLALGNEHHDVSDLSRIQAKGEEHHNVPDLSKIQAQEEEHHDVPDLSRVQARQEENHDVPDPSRIQTRRDKEDFHHGGSSSGSRQDNQISDPSRIQASGAKHHDVPDPSRIQNRKDKEDYHQGSSSSSSSSRQDHQISDPSRIQARVDYHRGSNRNSEDHEISDPSRIHAREYESGDNLCREELVLHSPDFHSNERIRGIRPEMF